MAKYVLSLEAQESLIAIKKYSMRNFGKQVTINYLEKIRNKMSLLAETPALGIIRDELKTGYFSRCVGSHTIYYRKKEAHIEIINVLHQTMDPLKQLHH